MSKYLGEEGLNVLVNKDKQQQDDINELKQLIETIPILDATNLSNRLNSTAEWLKTSSPSGIRFIRGFKRSNSMSRWIVDRDAYVLSDTHTLPSFLDNYSALEQGATVNVDGSYIESQNAIPAILFDRFCDQIEVANNIFVQGVKDLESMPDDGKCGYVNLILAMRLLDDTSIGFDWVQMYEAWKKYLQSDSGIPGMTNKRLLSINPYWFFAKLHI